MTFNSIQFVVLFLVVIWLYYRFGARGQNRLIIVAASVMYSVFDWRFLGLLYLSIVVNYVVGRGLARSDDLRRRRTLVGVSLAVQLGILGLFKYFDFFVASFTDVLDTVGLQVSPPLVDLILPIGLSFYSFQALAYVLHVYRRQIPAEEDFVTFAAFLAWFPQMLAGPIERPGSLLSQIRTPRHRPDGPAIESGIGLILQGLVKKVVISDAIAGAVNGVYAQTDRASWLALAIATAGFAIQVYGDFSGYSDVARGTSRLLGVELRRNFEQPLLSRNIQELWQRWHTSLSWWFLEFLGRPLIGRGASRRRTAMVTVIIFMAIGLWHGAAWTFVFWGLLNGLLVVAWRNRPVPKGQDPDRLKIKEAPRILFTFALFSLGGVFFRSASFEEAVTVFTRMLTFRGGLGPPAVALLVPVMAAAVVAMDLAERRRRIAGIEAFGMRTAHGAVARPEEVGAESYTRRASPIRGGAVVGMMLVALIVFSGGSSTEFLYFQF